MCATSEIHEKTSCEQQPAHTFGLISVGRAFDRNDRLDVRSGYRRGLAAWFAVGTRKVPSDVLAKVEGCPDSYFDALRDAGMPGQTVETGRLALRRTREAMAFLLPLVHQAAEGCEHSIRAETMPAEETFGPVPSWILVSATSLPSC